VKEKEKTKRRKKEKIITSRGQEENNGCFCLLHGAT